MFSFKSTNGWVGIVGINAIAISVLQTFTFGTNSALAQSNIVPDSTLGAENSIVTPHFNRLPIEVINGGAIRGQNLFHSFQEFNVGEGRGAYFFSPNANIQNILARVTGGNRSEILGTLGTFGNSTPNLFLINPNGIIFGRNARLDVRGSFLSSTANSFIFGNGSEFSAINSQTPAMLTINAPIGLQYGGRQPGKITHQGYLTVAPGRSLALVGGDLSLNSSFSQATGGRIELGGVAGEGIVGLNINNNNLQLNFPQNLPKADVSITNNAQVQINTIGRGGEGIEINARNLDILGGTLLAVKQPSLNSPSNRGGDITLKATGVVNIATESLISSFVPRGSTGRGGDVNITAKSLFVSTGAALGTITDGLGEAGSVIINTQDSVAFDGQSLAASIVQTGGIANSGGINITTKYLSLSGEDALLSTSTLGQGNAGDIKIEATSLSVTKGASLNTSNFGRGDAGDVTINATDTVYFEGKFSRVLSTLESGAVGRGGNISLTTGSLYLIDGAQLQSITRGEGDAGNLMIAARDRVILDGTTSDGFASGAASFVEFGSVGNGGDIRVITRELLIENGARLDASVYGRGNTGNIQVNADNSINLSGSGSTGFSSGLFTSTGTESNRAGEVRINTNVLTITDGSVIDSRNFSSSNGGNIIINANTFEAANGGQVLTTTANSGRAGDITLNVADKVTLFGSDSMYADRLTKFGSSIVGNQGAASGLFANTTPESTGNGGNIFIQSRTVNVPRTVTIRDGARIAVDSLGSGRGGNIEIQAKILTLDNQALISAETVSNQGGDIKLQLQNLLLLRQSSNISTTAGTARSGGDGGNITINSPFIVSVPQDDSNISANAFSGKGGRVNITARGIFGIQSRSRLTAFSDITAFSQQNPDLNGVIEINAPDVDPSQGLVKLPVNLVDISQQIATGCHPGGKQRRGSFTSTERGGVAPSPTEPLVADATLAEWVTLPEEIGRLQGEMGLLGEDTTPNSPTQIVEASGWVVDRNGDIVLVATIPHSPTFVSATCSGS